MGWFAVVRSRGYLVSENYLLVPCVRFNNKYRVSGLLCGADCVIIFLGVFVELRLVTDRQTDRQTDGRTQDNSIYRTSMASRGRNKVISVTETHAVCRSTD